MDNREHNRENKLSEEGMRRIREANSEREVSEETRKKMSESHLGQTPWNKEMTEDQKIFSSDVAFKREASKTPEQRSASAVKREANKRAKRLAA